MPLKVVCQCDGCGQGIWENEPVVRMQRGRYTFLLDDRFKEWERGVGQDEHYHEFCHINAENERR